MSNSREWIVFIKKLESAEEEFVRGRPAPFLALWSHSDDVTLCGGFGGSLGSVRNTRRELAPGRK